MNEILKQYGILVVGSRKVDINDDKINELPDDTQIVNEFNTFFPTVGEKMTSEKIQYLKNNNIPKAKSFKFFAILWCSIMNIKFFNNILGTKYR